MFDQVFFRCRKIWRMKFIGAKRAVTICEHDRIAGGYPHLAWSS